MDRPLVQMLDASRDEPFAKEVLLAICNSPKLDISSYVGSVVFALWDPAQVEPLLPVLVRDAPACADDVETENCWVCELCRRKDFAVFFLNKKLVSNIIDTSL